MVGGGGVGKTEGRGEVGGRLYDGLRVVVEVVWLRGGGGGVVVVVVEGGSGGGRRFEGRGKLVTDCTMV